MSKLNVCPPPQTYSRLFRPWDTKMEDSGISMASSSSRLARLKSEFCGMDSGNVDDSMCADNTELGHSDGEDNDLSSSSADNSINDFDSETPTPNTPPLTPRSNRTSLSLAESRLQSSATYTTSTTYFKSSEASLQQQSEPLTQCHNYAPLTMFSGVPPPVNSPSSSNFYYAAAALSIPNSMPNFNVDPYPLGMMGQEYARVIAEDAHMKALNARKQRPKKFKCPHCDVAFSNNGQLKGHIRIHTGERPFKCDAEGCGKTFTRNEELTRHKRIHTGLRPFPCSTCGKKFGRRDHLKKHMKTHLPQEHPLAGSAPYFMSMYPYLYAL